MLPSGETMVGGAEFLRGDVLDFRTHEMATNGSIARVAQTYDMREQLSWGVLEVS